MRQTYQPIETKAGVLRARDAIFFDIFEMDVCVNTLYIRGSLGTVEVNTDKDLSYSLTFFGVRCLKMMDGNIVSHDGESCFDRVINSEWIASLGYKSDELLNHYSLTEYDDTIDVICSGFELEILGI